MAITAAALRELHRIHRQLVDLRERLARGPRQIRAREANLAKIAEQQAAADEAVKRTRLIADQKQLDLKSSELKVADWQRQLNSCSSNKEYQTFQEQIAAAEMAGSVLADEILEALDKIDQLELSAVEVTRLHSSAKSDLNTFRDSVAQEMESVRVDIQRLEVELASAETKLPADFKTDYQRVIRNKGAEGMSEVEEQVCLGCGQQITLNMQNDLLLSKPVFCTSCGCLLYLCEN